MLQSFRTFSSLKGSFMAAAIAAGLALGLSASPAQAEFEQGDWEVRIAGVAENGVNFDGVTFSVSGAAGYFITDQFEAGVRQSFFYTDVGVPSTQSGQTTVFIDFHFLSPDDQLRPFIGAGVGYQYGDVEDLWLGGPEAGLKWFVDENWFLFFEVTYLFFFEDVDAADDQFDDGKWVWGLGIGARIPGQ